MKSRGMTLATSVISIISTRRAADNIVRIGLGTKRHTYSKHTKSLGHEPG